MRLIWSTLPDIIQRKTILIICGQWMAAGVAAFYFASSITLIILVQLILGLVTDAVWPIYYAGASDTALPSATSTATFIGSRTAPVLMSWLIRARGGWISLGGYVFCFLLMAGGALSRHLLVAFGANAPPWGDTICLLFSAPLIRRGRHLGKSPKP